MWILEVHILPDKIVYVGLFDSKEAANAKGLQYSALPCVFGWKPHELIESVGISIKVG